MSEPVHLVGIHENQQKFDAAYGSTMVQWGIIEQRMCFWFVYLTRMPDAMARSIFYDGANSFHGRNTLVRCAIDTAQITEGLRKCLRTVCNKAQKYNETRNALVHCETKIDVNPGSPTKAQVIMVEGGQPLGQMTTKFTMADFPTIGGNFRALSKLIMDIYEDVHLKDEALFQTLREQVHALPSSAVETQPNLNKLKD